MKNGHALGGMICGIVGLTLGIGIFVGGFVCGVLVYESAKDKKTARAKDVLNENEARD